MSHLVLKRLILTVSLMLCACAPALAAEALSPEAREAVADTIGRDWSRVPEYRMVPGDRLAINFGARADNFGDNIHEEYIRPDGRISIFPIGDVVAAGLTPMELQKSITSLLASDLRNPRVVVEVVQPAGNVVHVIGRVTKTGPVPATPYVTLLQAIGQCGGFMDDAARNSVLILHRDGARTVRVTRVRADRIMRGEDFIDPVLGRFDIVYVPRSTIGNIDVFIHQFFGETQAAVSTVLTGWELFNLDRVFVTRIIKE